MKTPLLHIYSQEFPHDDTIIVGDAISLAALEYAIESGSAGVELMDTDGEGYEVRIVALPEDDPRWPTLPPPYTHALYESMSDENDALRNLLGDALNRTLRRAETEDKTPRAIRTAADLLEYMDQHPPVARWADDGSIE